MAVLVLSIASPPHGVHLSKDVDRHKVVSM